MTNKAAQKLGRMGGKATLAKHGREKLREWGKMGGRPKKIKDICPHCGRELDQVVEESTNAILGLICNVCGWQERY